MKSRCPDTDLAVRNTGDMIEIDVPRRKLDVKLTATELKKRLKGWKPPKPRYKSGVLAKYSRHVASASEGAVTS